MKITQRSKRRIWLVAATIGVLTIPLIAMRFSDEVNWTNFDFFVAAILIFGTGMSLEFIVRKIKNPRTRILVVTATFIFLLLIWLELAVGVFGTPFAGR